MDRRRPRRPWLRRGAAVLLGVLAALVVLELGLRAAAALLPRRGPGPLGDCDVLCQGDSNVYGLYLEPEQSYPARLEALLRQGGMERAVVANRGLPGKTTWIVREELPADLASWTPEVVVIQAGVNTLWDWRVRLGRLQFLSGLRLTRVAFWLRWRAADLLRDPQQTRAQTVKGGLEIEALRDGRARVSATDRTGRAQAYVQTGLRGELDQVGPWIRDDLVACVETARAAGVLPVLVLYPVDRSPFTRAPVFAEVNAGIEAAARAAGAVLVDPRATFERAAQRVPWTELLYPDHHPQALGAALLARELLAAIARAAPDGLTLPAGLQAELERGPLADLPAPAGLRAWSEDGRVVGLEVTHTRGARVQLLLARAPGWTELRRGPGGSLVRVPLAEDALFARAVRQREALGAPLDADGKARIRLPAQLLAAPGGPADALWACALILEQGAVVAVSPPLEFAPR